MCVTYRYIAERSGVAQLLLRLTRYRWMTTSR